MCRHCEPRLGGVKQSYTELDCFDRLRLPRNDSKVNIVEIGFGHLRHRGRGPGVTKVCHLARYMAYFRISISIEKLLIPQ